MSTRPDSPLRILVAWRLRQAWHAETLLRRVARFVAYAQGFRTGELSIAVLGARAMATQHERFTGRPGPTDVLAFDLGADLRRRLLVGEILLCADVARQAVLHPRRPRSAGPSPRRRGRRVASALLPLFRAELALYLTHGLLHLSGYDDHSPAAFRRMHARELTLLSALGLHRLLTPVEPA